MSEEDDDLQWLSVDDKYLPIVGLTAEELMVEAEKTTGLSDWGIVPFRQPLRLYLKAIQEAHETGILSNRGRILFRGGVMRLLCNRLGIESSIQKNPSILETAIPRPLFLTGLPRTGSTLLHRLLSCDPNARYIRLCEGLYPIPPPDPATFNQDSRIGKTEKDLRLRRHLSETSDQKHVLASLEAEECNFLFQHSFVDNYFSDYIDIPAYEKFLFRTDVQENPVYYEDFRRIVQILGWQWPCEHWIFKSPRHMRGLRALLKVFSDARVVWLHRDPAEVVPSTCSLIVQERSIYAKETIPAKYYGSPVSEGLFEQLEIGLNARKEDEREHPERYLDIDYRELMADPIDTVRKIYQYFKYPFTSEFETAMQKWLQENPQNKHGRHKYAADDFGLQNYQIREKFASYCTRFCL